MAIITLTTDFGTGSPYVAAMKGVILSINPAVTLVDISHAVPAQDVRNGALVLENTTPWFPADTIHVAVVDPGVGTGREIVYARIGSQQYLAPDNGLLSRLFAKIPPAEIRRLANPAYWLQPVSATFHGRDIMAPVAARLSLGLDPRELGPPASQIAWSEWPEAEVLAKKIRGQVVEIDSFGNLITNIAAEMFAGRPTDTRVCVVCGIYETFGIYRTYAAQAEGMLVALVGSNGRLELALVGDNAAAQLGVAVGTPVILAWE
jgi:S-adenosylmethionine hydrolase